MIILGSLGTALTIKSIILQPPLPINCYNCFTIYTIHSKYI